MEIIGDEVNRTRRTGRNSRLMQLGEQIRLAKHGRSLLSGDVLLSGEASENSPHNTVSPHNTESATQSPPDHHNSARHHYRGRGRTDSPQAALPALRHGQRYGAHGAACKNGKSLWFGG
jgi:hypothetical protein